MADADDAQLVSIGLVGAGAMGSALGANWIAGGQRVVTCLEGRSERTRTLTRSAGVEVVDTLDEVVACDVVVSIVPPGEAVAVAGRIADAVARTGVRPLVADLNAVAPSTLASITAALGGLELVDGSISGGPPRQGRPTRVYLSGPHAAVVAGLGAPWLDVVVLPGPPGQASALKMCTASMYKGSNALIAQAMLTARRYGVLDEFFADVSGHWPDRVPGWPGEVALAVTKSARFVDEMLEIAATQRTAGGTPELFEGMAGTYRRLAATPQGHRSPESVERDEPVEDVLDRLRPDGLPAAVLFDFSSTLFYVESAEQALLAALGPDLVRFADEMRRWGAINGSSTPDELPPELAGVWATRDLSVADHRAAYAGLSRHAGLTDEQSAALYARGVAPEAWTPFRETLPLLRRLHGLGVPTAMVSNIGWDPRPVLAAYGATPYLDAVVLSYEVGAQKPDPAIFTAACAELGVDPRESVMIGDNAHADGAAAELGIRFVLVPADPGQRRGDELARAIGLG